MSKCLVCILHCFNWPDQRMMMIKVMRMMMKTMMMMMMINPPLKACETSAPRYKQFLIDSSKSYCTVQIIQGNLGYWIMMMTRTTMMMSMMTMMMVASSPAAILGDPTMFIHSNKLLLHIEHKQRLQ